MFLPGRVKPVTIRILISCIALVVTVGGMELLLRSVSFSYLPFKHEQTDAGPYSWVRLFSHWGKPFNPAVQDTRTVMPSIILPQHILPKKKNAIRVALLGGSTTHALSEADRMRDELERVYGVPVDVVNVGLLGQGSLTLLSVIDQVISLSPDIYVIATGHNEFLAAYYDRFVPGKLTVAVRKLAEISRTVQLVTYLYHSFESFVYGRYIVEHSVLGDMVLNRFKGKSIHSGYKFDESERKQVYGIYAGNLSAMVDRIRSSDPHARIILVAEAYNRRMPPEASFGKSSSAYELYSHCYQLDQQQRYDEAKTCYERVFVEDDTPRRSNEAINGVIKSVASKKGTLLLDEDAVMTHIAENGITDYGQFDDHCHLNAKGRSIYLYVLSRLIASSFTFPR